MSDNTTLDQMAGGDSIRDLARTGSTAKTQVMALDLGGPSSNAEVLITAGQQLMSRSVPGVMASDQGPMAVASSPASNSWSQALAVTNGATATLASVPVNSAGYQVKGFIAHGTGDGYFYVQINGVTALSGRTRVSLPTLVITLPNGIAVATGQTVTLTVRNESGSTADYEATLLGA